jgi:hypothetical protein
MQTRARTQRRTPKEPEAIIIPHDVTVLKLAQLFGRFTNWSASVLPKNFNFPFFSWTFKLFLPMNINMYIA